MKFVSLQKILDSVTYGAVFGFSAIFVVIISSFVYASTGTYYPSLSDVSTGSGLSSVAWNNLVNYANKAVKQETEVLIVTGGKVGVGTFTPSVSLDVNGSISSQGPA